MTCLQRVIKDRIQTRISLKQKKLWRTDWKLWRKWLKKLMVKTDYWWKRIKSCTLISYRKKTIEICCLSKSSFIRKSTKNLKKPRLMCKLKWMRSKVQKLIMRIWCKVIKNKVQYKKVLFGRRVSRRLGNMKTTQTLTTFLKWATLQVRQIFSKCSLEDHTLLKCFWMSIQELGA